MASRTGRKVARFSLQDVNTVAVLDLTTQDPALKGFASGFTDGGFAVFSCGSFRTGPPTLALRVFVIALGGRELALMDANGAWTKSDICSRISRLVRPPLRAARSLHGVDMVKKMRQ